MGIVPSKIQWMRSPLEFLSRVWRVVVFVYEVVANVFFNIGEMSMFVSPLTGSASFTFNL